MSNSQQMKKGLSVRDLITTGILAALYMVPPFPRQSASTTRFFLAVRKEAEP